MERNRTHMPPDENPSSFRNEDGLIIDSASKAVVGYLFNFPGTGLFSPDGRVDARAEEAQIHNRLLSQAEIAGLDNNCQVGQRGTLYFANGAVTTWIGELVSQSVTVRGQIITFRRNGKVFRGRLQKDANCFNFRRVS